MSDISAEEWEILSFFEVEPKLLESDESWAFNDAAYFVTEGDLTLSFSLAPAYGDVRIILKYNNERIYEINLMSVRDVRYTTEAGAELLEILINEHESLKLRVKPRIEMVHTVKSNAT